MLQEAYIHSIDHLIAASRHQTGPVQATGLSGTVLFHLLSGGHTEVIRACRTNADLPASIGKFKHESRIEFLSAQGPDGTYALPHAIRAGHWAAVREYGMLLRASSPDKPALIEILGGGNVLPILLDEIVATGYAAAVPALGELWSLAGLTRGDLLQLLPQPNPGALTIMQVALHTPGNPAARKAIAVLGQFGLLEAKLFTPD